MLEGVSDKANKVYDALKQAGATEEEKMISADRVMSLSKLGKPMALAGLQELEQKGYAKRKARQKSAGYFIIK